MKEKNGNEMIKKCDLCEDSFKQIREEDICPNCYNKKKKIILTKSNGGKNGK